MQKNVNEPDISDCLDSRIEIAAFLLTEMGFIKKNTNWDFSLFA